jgi:hypothetical protein
MAGEDSTLINAGALGVVCRKYRHQPIVAQHQKLKQKVQGHYAY